MDGEQGRNRDGNLTKPNPPTLSDPTREGMCLRLWTERDPNNGELFVGNLPKCCLIVFRSVTKKTNHTAPNQQEPQNWAIRKSTKRLEYRVSVVLVGDFMVGIILNHFEGLEIWQKAQVSFVSNEMSLNVFPILIDFWCPLWRVLVLRLRTHCSLLRRELFRLQLTLCISLNFFL